MKTKPDYRDVEIAAREIGMLPMWDYIDLTERLLVFNQLLTEGPPDEPVVLTLSSWVR